MLNMFISEEDGDIIVGWMMSGYVLDDSFIRVSIPQKGVLILRKWATYQIVVSGYCPQIIAGPGGIKAFFGDMKNILEKLPDEIPANDERFKKKMVFNFDRSQPISRETIEKLLHKLFHAPQQ